MDIIQDVVKRNIEFLEKYENFHNDLNKDCDSYFKEIDNFINTGNIDFFRKPMIGKENAESVLLNTNKRKGRANKPVLADITEVNVPTSFITVKKEKISDIPDFSKGSDANIGDVNINIKKEVEEMPAPTRLPPRKKKIKNEKVEVTIVKRSTRSRTRTKKLDLDISSSEKSNAKISSDVIIQNTTITTIEISDNEKDTETESEVEKNSYLESKSRTTRSKMKKRNKLNNCQELTKQSLKNGVEDEKLNEISVANIKTSHSKTNQKKRTRSDSVEEPSAQTESKKSRSSSSTERECNGSVRTEYEDAVSVLEGDVDKNENINVTYVAASKNSKGDEEKAVNATIIVENPKIMITKASDQVDVQVKPLENKSNQKEKVSLEPVKKTKGVKQVFSPYEKTPLKKKVEAFEKLGADNSNIPTRVTRSKKRTQKKDSKLRDNVFEEDERQKFNEKPKALTPIMLKFQPKVCSTSRINKLHPNYINDKSVNNDSILSVKSASALKASQAEFREREKRRQEKEREALRKKEALLQAQTEEKRRKREEKQQKAQQQRELYEKEKQKQLEAQRLKEEKYKQAMAEREEKLQRQKEEAEKKRMMVKKKATELKEKEEVIKMPELRSITEMKATLDKQGELAKLALRQKMERQQQSAPLYMTTRPPLLPTDDCYDSDDPEYDRVRRSEPSWSRDVEVRDQQMAMIVAGEKIKNTFFCRQAHTPDLQEIFELIDPRKLKRTSSAIWRKPPRYTLMPTIEDTPLFSEESD